MVCPLNWAWSQVSFLAKKSLNWYTWSPMLHFVILYVRGYEGCHQCVITFDLCENQWSNWYFLITPFKRKFIVFYQGQSKWNNSAIDFLWKKTIVLSYSVLSRTLLNFLTTDSRIGIKFDTYGLNLFDDIFQSFQFVQISSKKVITFHLITLPH